MNYEAWFEHFKEQLQGLTESFDHSGSKLSLLGFALKENFLSSEEYLKWAMTHYKLPMLQSQFFTETSPSLELFAKWAALYRWSEECLPVAEWDGSLIIACLQPPQDFSSSESPIVVLTSAENLQRAWEKLNPPLSEKQLTQNVDDTPTGVDLSFATSLKKSPSDNFSIEDLGMAEIASDENQEEISLDENNDSEKKLSLEEGLEGLFDQPAVIELKGLSANTTDHNKTETLDENKVEKIVPAVEEQKLKPIPPPPAKIQPEAVKKEEDKSSSEESEASISLEQGTIIKPISRSTGIAKPTLNPAPLVGSFPLDKIKKRNSALLNEKIKTTLSQMKTQFEKAMILTLDDEE
ncbi:MAG: hypothetical protein ACXVCR_19280, partial [Bdellovibrio sp.]